MHTHHIQDTKNAATSWKFRNDKGETVQVPSWIQEKVLRDERIYFGQTIKVSEVNLPEVGWEELQVDLIPVKVLERSWIEFNEPCLDTFWSVEILLPKNRLIEIRDDCKANGYMGVASAIELVLNDPKEICYIPGFSYELSPSLDAIVDYCAA